jgi:hypothetical protein
MKNVQIILSNRVLPLKVTNEDASMLKQNFLQKTHVVHDVVDVDSGAVVLVFMDSVQAMTFVDVETN